MDIKRNFDLLTNLAESYPKEVAIAGKSSGKWTEYSTATYIEIVNNLSYGFLSHGLRRGDRMAIISFNRPEWNFVDFAASQIGIITVPMYPTASIHDYRHILNDAEVKLVLVEKKEYYQKLKEISAETPTVKHIFSFDEVPGVKYWKELLETGKNHQEKEQLNELRNEVDPGDLLTIIYTSGTTGVPKGVMLSHDNIMSNVNACRKICPVTNEHRVLSFLPLCHIFERMMSYLYHRAGATIYYAESMETIGDNLKEVRPYAFSTVPRLLEKVYDKIIAKGHELSGIKKRLFFWAVNLGLRYELHRKNGWWYHTQLKMADKLIFSKWRAALGGEVGLIVSGAAALQPRLARVFMAAGIQVLEGYGLTETSPVITVNRLEHENRMFGTVGPPIENVEVQIAADGEILCRGPNVMMGYYKNPEGTREVIDQDGWFHTGDIGSIVDNRMLKITDRKKEVFKTSGGKYIAPQPMENKFKESLFIEQIMVIGEGQKFAAALIVPAWDYLRTWCAKNDVEMGSYEEMARHPVIIKAIQAEIDRYNTFYGDWEALKKFALIPGEWTIDGGEMTPTLKLKRKKIIEKYQHLVAGIYS